MKPSSRFLVVALVLFSLVSSRAEEPISPQRTAKAEELMGLLDIDKNMDSAFAQVAKMQEQMIDTKGLSPEAREKQAKVRKTITDATKSIFSWTNLKSAFIQIYAETFTEEELQGMIDFFKTPVGRRWIEKQPQLQAATMQKMQSIMLEAQPKIQEIIKKEMDAEKPAGAAASPSATVNPPFVK